jgi:hypothetical protein
MRIPASCRPAHHYFFIPALAAVAVIGIGSFAVLAQAQQAAPQATANSSTGSAAPVGVRSLDTLPPMAATARQTRTVPFETGVDPLTYAARKADAARRRFVIPQKSSISGPPAAAGSLSPSGQGELLTPITGVTITGVKQSDCGGWDPADQALAVGDTSIGVLQVVNECIIVYDKNGSLQPGYPKSLNSYFGQNGCGIGVFDPRAIYDWINHRYIVLGVDKCSATIPNAGSYWIAVTSGDSPTGAYCIYHLPVQSDPNSDRPFPDYPRLGQDRQGIYIAGNVFTQTTNPNTFRWEEILALPKAQMYACQNINFQFYFKLNLGGTFTDSTQPADTYNPGDDPREMYFVTSRNINFGGGQCSGGCNGLTVWGLYGIIGSQTLTGVNVSTGNNYSLAPAASQPGSANSIETLDTRITGSASYSSGSIYASLTSNGGGGGSVCILYQIKPFVTASNGAMASATIQNEIIHFSGGGTQSWFFCTQQPDPEGNVTHVFNYSSSSAYVGLAYATRRAAQPTGTIPDSGIYLVVGQGLNTGFRWGDYTATAPAGLVSGGGTGGFPTFWFAGMFARNDNSWGTAIGRNGYTDVTQAISQK